MLLLFNVKPAGMLGFWPDAGIVKARGALPIFVTATVLCWWAAYLHTGKIERARGNIHYAHTALHPA